MRVSKSIQGRKGGGGGKMAWLTKEWLPRLVPALSELITGQKTKQKEGGGVGGSLKDENPG